jgi:hypothetical protein
MRNIFGLQVETKISLAIVVVFAIIMVITVLKSVDSFNAFSKRINNYEELRIQKSE